MTTDTINIWRMDKDPLIKAVLLMLTDKAGPNSFIIIEPEKLDNRAVRIASGHSPEELSVYIYTYAQEEQRFGLDLEFPYLIETRADDQTIRLNDLDADQVYEKVVEHLEIVLQNHS